MILNEKQKIFIDGKIAEHNLNYGSIIRSQDQELISILLWNPMADQVQSIKCPTHEDEKLRFLGKWTHNSTKKGMSPRLLYGVEENTMLVSALYNCQRCENPYRAHHPSILRQQNVGAKFHLFTCSGLTEEAYNLIISLVSSGLTFEGISTTLQRAKGQRLGSQGIAQEPMGVPKKFSSPSRKLCKDIFIYDFYEKLPFYESTLKKIKPSQVSIDHTFKVAALLKINDCSSVHKSKKFRQPFSSLFLALDEGGRVALFTLSQTKSLAEIYGNLTELAARTGQIKMAHSDNCCSDEKDIKLIFGPETPIKLDIFHALARVTSEVKKRTISIKHRRLFNQQLKMAVRRRGDKGPQRTQATASQKYISECLETLKQQWKDIIPESAVKAIDNLLVHSKKGCMR